tara:strand:- start:1124 stop:1231 length:108 start_codon:yes stop_codon:yes gene_type:complete
MNEHDWRVLSIELLERIASALERLDQRFKFDFDDD